jgi:hypothetical protein
MSIIETLVAHLLSMIILDKPSPQNTKVLWRLRQSRKVSRDLIPNGTGTIVITGHHLNCQSTSFLHHGSQPAEAILRTSSLHQDQHVLYI